jgi:hypothetical protein
MAGTDRTAAAAAAAAAAATAAAATGFCRPSPLPQQELLLIINA